MRTEERVLGGVRIRIDRTLCVGFGDCIDVLPEVFRLDEDDIATFTQDASAPLDRLREACLACPVDALEILDAEGRAIDL